MRTCRDCGATKLLDEFPVAGRAKAGHRLRRSMCRPCYSIARGKTPGAIGRPKGSTKVAADRIVDLLSISCEWWTVDGVAGRLGCSPRTIERHLEPLYESGALRRRQRLTNGVWEYQADPFWMEGAA